MNKIFVTLVLATIFIAASADGNCTVANCTTCDSSSNTTCATCSPGFYLNASNSSICAACNSSCANCTAAGNDKCTACASGYFNNTVNGTSTCNACSAGCSVCSAANNCTTCAAANYLNGSACSACVANCTACKNSTSCDTCATNTTFKSDKNACVYGSKLTLTIGGVIVASILSLFF
mmetsp:Transcript_22780/g.26417  ORF Transcript_22780/g.26417 Transcript_22780/m.26417 type:complete len:178 (+) Transcript_22780:66-599(+)